MNHLSREQNLLFKAMGGSFRDRNLRLNDLESNVNALQKAIFHLVDLSHAATCDEAHYAKPLVDKLLRHKEGTLAQRGVARVHVC